ncbi:MAG: C25 family cysteine peptidase [Sedimentisphaerales bacterium]
MFAKKYFLISSLIIIIASICNETEAKAVIEKGAERNKIVLEYKFGEPIVSSKAGYDSVQIKGLESYQRTGAPVVPVRPATILVPFGKKVVSTRVVVLDSVELPGTYLLAPAQKPYPLNYAGKLQHTGPDPAIYSQNSPWPEKNHEKTAIHSKRGYQLFTVNLFPVQYVPATGKITYATKMRLEIDLADSQSKGMLRPTPETIKALKKHIDNPTDLARYDSAKTTSDDTLNGTTSLLPGGPYQYVIITNQNLAGVSGQYSFQGLRDAKIASGISATIVTTEWIYANYDGTKPNGGSDNQTRIRNFLIDAYQHWGTEYVLLGGTNAIVPARMFWVDSHAGEADTMPVDMYYGCVDPPDCNFDHNANGIYGETNDGVGGGDVDLYAEIYVGRAPVESATEVANFVKKTLAYNSTNSNYLTRVSMLGEYLGFSGVSEYATDMMEQVRLGGSYDGYFTYGFENNIQPDFYDFNTSTNLYDSNTYDWPKSELINLMNSGVNILNHIGHSNETYNMKLDTSDLRSLTNTDYFFAYSQGCDSGAFDTSNCFAEVITTMENGAFAVVMNARYGWGQFNSTDGPSQRFARQFWDASLGEDKLELGRTNQDSKEDNLWDINGECIRWCYYELNLFGDPQQQFRFRRFVVHLTKVNDVNAGDCVWPGRDVNYTIDYNYPAGLNFPDINDVNIIDNLPNELKFISSIPAPNNIVDSNKIIWNLGTLSPGESGSITLKVKVKFLKPGGGKITNECEIRSSGIPYNKAEEPMTLCPSYPYPIIVKDDNITGCVGPGDNITYNICYDANGCGDTNVVITDYLPKEVNYISSNPAGAYHHYSDANTVTWSLTSFPPDACGCITLATQVKNNVIGGTITNYCELKSDYIDIGASKINSICSSWCPIYVDANATGGNNGYSWADAFKNLQDAHKAAKDSNCNEILVAQGIYKPDIDSAHPGGSGDRTATFQLLNNVAIYGGFPPGGGTWQQRNPAAYETILSGDLLGNDGEFSKPEDMLNAPSRSENSFHVVTGSDVNNTAVLDGFTITGGDANGEDYLQNAGGGMLNYSGSPIVRNCTFKWNSASGTGYDDGGGGIYIAGYNSSINKIMNCLFKNNWAAKGGGIHKYAEDVNITNCTFVGNGVDGVYLIIYPGSGNLTITNCILWGNEGQPILDWASVTYSDVEGGCPGQGNINEDPMLEPDGLHLTPCSPCIDAGTNTPPGGLPETDIDGQNRIMNGHCQGNAVVDMGADEFPEYCNIWLSAYCPKPISEGTATFYIDRAELIWVAGGMVAATHGHQVYFGTDFNDVNNATTETGAPIYRGDTNDPCYPLKNLAPDYILTSGTTYYWRVDEDSGTNIWKGAVWNFTMPNPAYLFVDDFSSSADFAKAWQTGYQNNGGSNLSAGGNILSWDYDNTGATVLGTWSEAKLDYSYVSSTGVDWTLGGVYVPKALAVQFDGNMGNTLWGDNAPYPDPNYGRLYMGIEDAKGHFGFAYYTSDPYAPTKSTGITGPGVREFKVALSDLISRNNVDLTEVNRVYLGIGIRGSQLPSNYGGSGQMKFANLRLRVCTADFNNDSVVNLYDMKIMSQEWLTNGPIADIFPVCNPDGIVDFRDFAVLANEWLTEIH